MYEEPSNNNQQTANFNNNVKMLKNMLKTKEAKLKMNRKEGIWLSDYAVKCLWLAAELLHKNK